jgi:hypothetical protein
MNKEKGPRVKKFGPYIPVPLIEAITEFSDGKLSDATRGAVLAWMALDANAREAIDTESKRTDVKTAIENTRKIIKKSVSNQILLDHARALPKHEQARIVQKSLEHGKE